MECITPFNCLSLKHQWLLLTSNKQVWSYFRYVKKIHLLQWIFKRGELPWRNHWASGSGFCFASWKTNLGESQSQSNSEIHISKAQKTLMEMNRYLLKFINFNGKVSKLTKYSHNLTNLLSLGTEIIKGGGMITLSFMCPISLSLAVSK